MRAALCASIAAATSCARGVTLGRRPDLAADPGGVDQIGRSTIACMSERHP
jgi:hypothetical protein